MIEIIKNPNIDFMGLRKFAFGLSGVLIAIGLFALVQIGTGSANLGIDFAGGTSVQVQFSASAPLQQVRSALEEAGLKDFDLQDLPGVNKILVRVKKQEDEALGATSALIIDTLSARFTELAPVVDSTTEIGPKVGGKLRLDALKAILYSIIGILAYVSLRFQFRFAVGATVATFHDVLAVLGIFFLMGKEINLVLVSALLMIAGYSLTDTVVVFDRIRENLRSRFRGPVGGVINSSINEVLSRTVIVSLTTLFSALALYIFGGEVIHDFALAIILGVLIGTYSSVFVASPVVLLWGGKGPLFKKR
jgi:preprotein translocase subunit SecF